MLAQRMYGPVNCLMPPSESSVAITLEPSASGLVASAELLHGTGHLLRTAPNGRYRCRPLAQDTEMSS